MTPWHSNAHSSLRQAFVTRGQDWNKSQGTSINQTAAFMKCSRADVVKVFKDRTVSQKAGSQCAICSCYWIMKVQAEWRLSRLVKGNRRATVQQIRANLNEGSCQMISEHNICHTLHHMGHGSWIPVWTPLLSAVNKRNHLHFAQEYKYWTVDNWKQITWSDGWITFSVTPCWWQSENLAEAAQKHGPQMQCYNPPSLWRQCNKLGNVFLWIP